MSTGALQISAIALGGAGGALLRSFLVNWMYALTGGRFPWGTLLVNLMGSLLAGFLYVLLVERAQAAVEWRALLMVGFLGALTTFSAFSLDTLHLFENGRVLLAGSNIVLNVVLCLLLVWLGAALARQIF
jgi:CrcB protein